MPSSSPCRCHAGAHPKITRGLLRTRATTAPRRHPEPGTFSARPLPPGGGAWANSAPALWLAAAAIEMSLFAASVPRTRSWGLTPSFTPIFWTAAHPALFPRRPPSADSFPPAVRGREGSRHLLAIVARSMAMTRITEGGRWEGSRAKRDYAFWA